MSDHRSSGRLELVMCLLGLLGLLATARAAHALEHPLVLARQQSAFAHDTLASGALTVTYWLGNTGGETLAEPLLATTLAPGVTLEAAEPPARTRGADVVIPLSAIAPGGSVAATLTLRVPPGASTLDDGARAFTSLGTRAEKATVGPTTLRAMPGGDPALLASTPDAPTGDPGVLRMLGSAGCDPAALLAAVRDGTTHEVYRGALRGARGVLRTSAGNALDRASLLVALLRACGIPARWAAGTLAPPQARLLIESMFDGLAPRTVGGLDLPALSPTVASDLTSVLLEPAQLLPGAGVLASPADDPVLLADAARHHWVEYDDGSGFVALDPSFPAAAPGDAFTTASATFAEVPIDEHHTVRLRLDAEIAPVGLSGNFLEIADALATALGTPVEGYAHVGNVLVQTETVLDATFTSVELVGQPLTLGHFVDGSTTGGAGLTATRNVYAPWLQVGDRPDLIRGTDMEEFISTFASDLLTGLFLRVTVTGPDGAASEHERELVDRIGYAARRHGGASPVALDGTPVLTDADVVTIEVNVGGWDAGEGFARADAALGARAALAAGLDALPAGTPSPQETGAIATLGRRYATAVTRHLADAQVGLSHVRGVLIGRALGVRGYAASPRLTLAQVRSRALDGTPETTLSLDLRKRDGVAVPAPGRPVTAAQVYETARGLDDAYTEGFVVDAFGATAPVSFERFVAALAAAGGALTPIEGANLDQVDALALPADARARIRAAVAGGAAVLAPLAPVPVDGAPVTMWLELDPETGEAISVGEDGGHQAALEYETLAKQSAENIIIGFVKGLDCEGCEAAANLIGVILGAKQFWEGVVGNNAGLTAGGSFGGTLAYAEFLEIVDLPPQTPWEHTGWTVGTAAKTLFFMSAAVNKALEHRDPPLSGLVMDPDTLFGAGSTAVTTIAAPAAFAGATFDAAVGARYHRAGDTSFYPAAVAAGLGASGGAPALSFEPSTALALTDAELALDADGGQVTLGTHVLPAPVNVSLTGVTGSFAAADAGATDTVTASGSFARALVLDVVPTRGPAARDNPLVVTPQPRSNAADDYDLTVEAPRGWEVTIEPDGTARLLPPPGVISGSATVRVRVRSRSVPSLAAEASVVADATAPGTPRVLLSIAPDPTFSVPIAGTLVPTAQRITLTNLGPAADTFDLTVDGIGRDEFTLAAPSPVVGAGESAVVGLALHPGGDLLPPGTPIGFTVRAAGRTTGLAAELPATVPYPTVLGVRPSLEPLGAHALPGDTVAAELVLAAAGNAPATMALRASAPSGLTMSGLPASVTLQPGETRRVPLTVVVATDATVGRSLPITLTADLCNGLARPPCPVPDPSVRAAAMGILVGVPQTLCLLDGTITAALADLAGPAITLQRLALALSRLALAPGDVVLQSESIAATNATMAFLHAQGLTERANQLHDLMLPVEAGDLAGIAASFDALCTELAGLPGELETVAERAAHGFTARLTPSNRVVAPGEPAVYGLDIVHAGTRTTTIDLALAGIPAGVTAALSQARVTLAPGARLDPAGAQAVTVTLTAAAALPSAAAFAVRGTVAGGFTGEAPGVLAVRESAVDVAAVTPTPRIADAAGTPVAIAARLSNRANVARDVVLDLRVEDETGTTVVASPPTPATVGTGDATTVDLGSIDTAALADGAYSAVVTARTPGGGAIPGQQGRGTFLVGLPLQATAIVEPATVAPGDAAQVLSRVRVSGRPPRQPGTGFFDQYAQAVAEATAVVSPGAALGVPDRQRATVEAGGVLTIDLGPDLARVTDGPGADLVVFERDACTTPHEASYTVAVADDPAGPFVALGTASGARDLGDEFDLLAGGVTAARYVRISADGAPVEIDAVLNAHPARPGGVELEYHHPVGFQSGVANTPAIGDLDGDGNPEIAFNVQTSFVGCEMIVLDGVTREEKFRLDMPGRTSAGAALCGEASGVAMGNLDDDPEGEILVHAPTDNVIDVFVALNADGSELFRVTTANDQSQTSIDLANLDADPRPEILWPGGFLDDDTSAGLRAALFGQPIAVDLDGDGTPELVGPSGGAAFSSIRALRIDGTEVWNSPSLATGGGAKSTSRPAVADLDGDGRPDFAAWAANLLGHTQGVHAVRHDGSLLWSTPVPEGPRHCQNDPEQECIEHADCPGSVCKIPETAASVPAVADVNGDGRPEVVVWLRDTGEGDRGAILAFEGATGRELWRVDAHDPGGIEPSLSAADLDGDGDAEVLWNGSCDGFTIVDGAAGQVVYRDPRARSGSGRDHPAVADADADGRLEVVTGDANGLYVFGAGAGWASGRRVWNQTNYSITNVEDDLTIPAAPPEPWRFHNTARFQGPQLADLARAAVDVTHGLADDAAFDPAAIVPPAQGVSGQTIGWAAEFPAVAGAAFDVPVTLPALAPGETRTVSTGGSVAADLVLLDGSRVQVTIPLEPAAVSAPHVIAIAPASQAAAAGTPATFLVTLTNARGAPETFTLTALGIDPAFVELPPATTVDPGAQVVLPLVVTLPIEAPDGILDFALTVRGDAGTADDAGAQLVVHAVAPPVVPGGIRVAIAPDTATLGRGGETILDVLVTSGLDRVATLALSAVAADLGVVVSDPELVVAPGSGGAARTRVTVQAPAGAAGGPRPLTVTATEVGAPHVTDTFAATVAVSDRGVQVALSPDAATTTPDGRVVLEAAIINTGVAADTFDLATDGPLAPFAALGATTVTVDAGAAATVAVTLAGLDVFLQQRTFLVLTASATTEPAITARDASAVDVSLRRAVAAQLTPASISRVGAGSVALDLAIANTGNACDERYLVDVASSPAGIVGAIAPSRFVVPPGQAAILRLEAASAVLGDYDLEVMVTTDATNPACPPLPAAAATAMATISFTDGASTTSTTTTTSVPSSTASTTTTTSSLPATTSTTTSVTSTSTTSTLPGIDHFLLYKVKPGAGSARLARFAPLELADGFGSGAYEVVKPEHLGTPGDKNGEGLIDPATHLVDYQVKPVRGAPKFATRTDVQVTNQCGALWLELSKPSGLLAPALASLAAPPPPAPQTADHHLDHYLCYKAKPRKRLADGSRLPKFPKGLQVNVADRFETRRYDLKKVTRLCTPAETSGTPLVTSGPDKGVPVPVTPAPIRRPDEQLLCYRVKVATRYVAQTGCGPLAADDRGATISPRQAGHTRRDPIFTSSLLATDVLASVKEAELCIPSAVALARP